MGLRTTVTTGPKTGGGAGAFTGAAWATAGLDGLPMPSII